VQHPNHYTYKLCKDSVQQHCLIAIVQDAIIKKTKSYKTTLAVQYDVDSCSAIQGEVLAYFTQCDSTPLLQPGDKLILQSQLVPIKNNGNIGEFDYKAYCNNKGITHLLFLKPKQYKILAKGVFTFTSYFANIKIKTINILRKYITNTAAFGIAQALLIGDKTDIDQDTWDAYSRTGIVHIIAISGMHMGIIYNCLLWLLMLIPFFKKRKMYPIITALLSMWFFACITGMPASVMRAAVMFTFIGAGQAINRQGNSYNLLMASAFILLCYNPTWLTDIGFLLSYAAVIGIMIFAKRINSLVYSKYYIVNQIWSLFSATIGAQIFTLPLCLYFFHQFPILFLLSNLVAIPATTLILFLEIGVLAFAWLPPFAKLLGGTASVIIIWLNRHHGHH
jgi:competence protein ComEC